MFDLLITWKNKIFGKTQSTEYTKLRQKFWKLKDICTKENWTVELNKDKKTVVKNGEFPISPKLFTIMRSILIALPDEYFKILQFDIIPFADGKLGLEIKDENSNSLTLIISTTNEIVYITNIDKEQVTEVNSGTILMTIDYFSEIVEILKKEFKQIQN